MIDWLTIVIALVIITSLVGGFGFLAWKINMSDPLVGDSNDESVNDKRKKDKNSNEPSKKKRKDQKKWKRESKDEEEKQTKKAKSSETDDEREESEQELLNAPVQSAETSSKARKRNKNKNRSTTPPPPSASESHTKTSAATRAPPVTHPKSAPKDEHESTKQQAKAQTSNKQALPTSANNKKPTQNVQKQQKQQQQEDQSFTVVGSNRHKNATSTVQQNKPQVTPAPPVVPVQQTPTAPVQHEQLVQRQQTPPQKETPVAVPTVKQSPPKIADLIKVLPSSQIVVTELMSALDAFPLSPDELDIIMHKIANKQSVVKQDWSKLQQGQKVDPQAHIGQVLDESAKAYEDDLKHNSGKRVKELTAELNAEKRRNNELLKEKADKEREIQILHAQLDSTHHKVESTASSSKGNPQQKLQALELQLQRVTEDNILLTQQLAQQTASTLTSASDAGNMKVQVLSDQIKKLSVDNANLEKKAHSNELLAKEALKEKEDLIRYNEQLTQSLQKAEKDLQHVEEKHHKQLNDIRTTNLNEINEYKNHLKQLENENEQLKREEIVHVEPSTATDIQTITINNEEQEQLENEIQQLKQQKEEQHEHHKNELNALRVELSEAKSTVSRLEERLRQQRQVLTDLLSQELRKQLPNDNQDSDQWLSSYRQVSESHKQNLHEESEALKRENVQLNKNMTEIENQLKEIENTVQSKEETLLKELKSKDAVVEKFRNENEQLKNEIQHLQSIHQASVSEARALKLQLDERFAANSPSIVAADESFELVKQISPSQSPIVIDMRAEQLNELIRSSKEALENQDSATQQLDKHLNDMQHSGIGETSTVSSSSNQQS